MSFTFDILVFGIFLDKLLYYVLKNDLFSFSFTWNKFCWPLSYVNYAEFCYNVYKKKVPLALRDCFSKETRSCHGLIQTHAV